MPKIILWFYANIAFREYNILNQTPARKPSGAKNESGQRKPSGAKNESGQGKSSGHKNSSGRGKPSDKPNTNSPDYRDRMHERRVQRATKAYERHVDNVSKNRVKRDDFLARNDARLENVRRMNDEGLARERKKADERLQRRAEKTGNYDGKAERRLANHREKVDHILENHRDNINRRRLQRDEWYEQYEHRSLQRAHNRLERIKADKKDLIAQKIFNNILFFAILDMVILMGVEIFVPGSTLKRYEIIDDTIRDAFIKPKEFAPALSITEEQYLWDVLMDHFNGNEIPVLGIMCNLYSESEIRSNNLENLNNQNWTISDVDYTDKVNRLVISKQDFIKSQYKHDTSGYLNENNVWRNKDGGYGYAQYTSSDKKEALYEFASEWYDKGGPGEDYRFDISNPEMQAHFIVYLLEHDYKNIDRDIRNCSSIVDACYIWLKKYEIPYDPYKDGYYTLAFERASSADLIRKHCTEAETGTLPRHEDPEHTPGSD